MINIKNTALFIFLLTISFARGQNTYKKELSLRVDNDLFISFVNDRYYSSGLFFEYRYSNNQVNLRGKIIHEWSLNQEIYTPYKSIVQSKFEHDRPFAGLLYLSYSQLKTTDKAIITNEYQLGVVGPLSLGKQFQQWIHNIYGFPEPIGWKYQIQNSLGLHYKRDVIRKLSKAKSRRKDYFLSHGYQIGTLRNTAQLSLMGRIGLRPLQDFRNSVAFRTNLNTKAFEKSESLFYWKVLSKIVLYDATMQGSLFNNDSEITFTPNRFQFTFELVYLFTYKSWGLGYKAVYTTNERSHLTKPNGHLYGSVFLSRRFR